MKLVWHLLRKELRLSRAFLIPMIVLQLVRVASLLGWFGSPAPTEQDDGWLTAFVVTIAGGALVGLMLVLFLQVLANNSPARDETFVSTRPVSRRELVVSKLLTLMIWVVVPFGLVELIHLWSLGWSFGGVALGVLQMILSMTAVVVLIMALGWMWRSKREGWIAYVAGFVVIAGSVALCALFTVYYWDQGTRNATQFMLETAFSLPRVFVALVLAGIISWMMLIMQWRRTWPFGRRLMAACLMLALIMVGMWFAPRRGVEVIEMDVPVGMRASLEGPTMHGGKKSVRARLLPEVESLVEDYEVKWMAKSVAMNGRSLRLPPLVSPQTYPDWWVSWQDREFAIGPAVKKVVGSDRFLMVNSGIRSNRQEAHVIFPSDHVSGGEAELDVELVRQRFEWKLYAELPMKKGAQYSQWKLEGVVTPEGGPSRLLVSLSERTSSFWMAGEDRKEDWKSWRFLLVDDETGICRVSEGFVRRRTIGSFSAAPWQGYRVEFNMGGDKRSTMNLDRARLLVFQSEWHDSALFDWEGKLKLKEVTVSRGLAKDSKDGDPEELLAWLSEHPAPDSGASAMEVAKQVVAILERTNHFPNYLPEDHPAIVRLAGFVPDHLDLLLKARDELAMDQHYSRDAMDKAIGRAVRKEQVLERLMEFSRISKVMVKAMKRGWLDDVSAEIADAVRMGDDRLFFYALRLPDRAGLSDDECLAVFRRNPTPHGYGQLRRFDALKDRVDAEIDEWFEGSLRQVTLAGTDIDTPLLLALHRGRADAPEALQQVMKMAKAMGGVPYADNVLQACFNPEDFSEGHGKWTEGFLETDPTSFEFDVEERRYRLKKP